MPGKIRLCPGAVQLMLLVLLCSCAAQIAHAATSPQNIYGLPVTYNSNAAAGTLKVRLRDAILGGGLASVRIVAHEIRNDGRAYWAGEQTTDSNGVAVFQLKNLGKGGRYYLKAFAWHALPVYTRTLTAPGTIVWKTGRVRVRVQNATLATPAPLASYEVILRRTNGTWSRRLTTDSQGIVRLDPEGLGNGIGYQIRAISPLGGDMESSRVINAAGTYNFPVGNRPLVVTLRSGTSNNALAGKAIIVWQKMSDGTEQWVARGTTDSAGKVIFELDSLGRGGSYFLRTNPFNVRWLNTQPITDTGNFEILAGSTPVTLIDEASGNRLAGKQLVAMQVGAGKKLAWYAKGQTNASGKVFFDFPETSSGSVFVVKAVNPFGNGENFYTKLIRAQGALQLPVRKGTAERIDLNDPLISILSPARGSKAAAGGFLLQGKASDDRKIDKVMVDVRSAGKQRQAQAWLNPASGRWYFNVAAATLTAGSNVSITVTAIDTTNNRQTSSINYAVIDDTREPVTRIFSPANGATVSMDGFTLKGNVSDQVAASQLVIRVEAANGSNLVPREAIDLLPGSRRWAHNLFPRRWGGSPARIVLEAHDYSGNINEKVISVTPRVTARNHRRLVDRVSFGTTEAQVQLSRSMGWGNYLEMQLTPGQIDESALNSRLGPVNNMNRHDLVWRTLQRMIYSERQLLELMTWFWDNHFSTDIRASNVQYEYHENQAFRQHALGRFRDILEASAKSPAMLRYLDSTRNYKRHPNENYARELMELHTLGVNGGYTQQDIEELSRIFSGWHVQNDKFYFRATAHDSTDKHFLGTVIRGGGVKEGEQVLDILASHPSTARFICTKLVRFFVADQADAGLVSACAATFTNTNGDIAAVLRRILKSQAFYDAVANNTRFKSPLRFTTGAVRALGVTAERRMLLPALQSMGMELYTNPEPVGWPIAGDAWVNADQLLKRSNLVFDLFDRAQETLEMDLSTAATAKNAVTGAGILGMFMDNYFARRMTYREYKKVLSALNRPDVFDAGTADAERRLRQALRTMLVFPASHIY